jgi:hypothetical protein
MNLLVNLYSESKLIREGSKTLGSLRKKGCEVIDDLSGYESQVACTVDEDYHIRSVLTAKDSEREYSEFMGKISDSHLEIEKLGVCRYAKEYTTIISLEDSLDYILHRKCGADLQAVRSIEGYDVLSRNLLKFNFDGLLGFTVDSLCGVDPKLDAFIASLVKDTPEHTDGVENEFLLEFVKSVILESCSIIEYVGLYYNSVQSKGTSVIRGKSFCSFVLTTAERQDGEIVIVSEGYSNYKLKVRSFAKKEYAQNLNLRYAE